MMSVSELQLEATNVIHSGFLKYSKLADGDDQSVAAQMTLESIIESTVDSLEAILMRCLEDRIGFIEQVRQAANEFVLLNSSQQGYETFYKTVFAQLTERIKPQPSKMHPSRSLLSDLATSEAGTSSGTEKKIDSFAQLDSPVRAAVDIFQRLVSGSRATKAPKDVPDPNETALNLATEDLLEVLPVVSSGEHAVDDQTPTPITAAVRLGLFPPVACSLLQNSLYLALKEVFDGYFLTEYKRKKRNDWAFKNRLLDFSKLLATAKNSVDDNLFNEIYRKPMPSFWGLTSNRYAQERKSILDLLDGSKRCHKWSSIRSAAADFVTNYLTPLSKKSTQDDDSAHLASVILGHFNDYVKSLSKGEKADSRDSSRSSSPSSP